MKRIKKLTRKFMNDLADSIYRKSEGKACYMHLCARTLTNGPDPKDPKRKMHCGLGELYFAMTGKHADLDNDNVDEDGVIDLAVMLAGFDKPKRLAAAAIRKAGLEVDLQNDLLDRLNRQSTAAEDDFRDVLDSIPTINDRSDTYPKRAKRVAAKLRDAAKLLPP